MGKALDELKRIDIFSELSHDDLSALSEICTPLKYSVRDIIAREGVDAESLFAFIEGRVGIWVDYGTEKADLLASRDAPCLVGEIGVADQLPRSATIVADTPLTGYNIDAQSFRGLLEKRGSIALCLLKGISRLVRVSNNSFVSELRINNAELMQANKELKTAQKQLVIQERLSSLGKFSSMIIHDLRNPLSVIRGYIDLLEIKLEDHSEELHKFAKQIRRETSRLSGLTSEWLDYSRGEIRLAYSPVNIKDLFRQLKENVEPGLNAKGLNVCWNVDFAGTAMLDQERLLRVLVNLSDNARKACKYGGSIVFSSSQHNQQYLLLKIKDNGTGMDKETLDHAFEPFYSTSVHGGTGLGMHIVKTVIEAHEGSVHIVSSLGNGTEITISLPLRL